jgi:hypothetical protein
MTAYGIFDGYTLLFNFYATDDSAAIREAKCMGWEPENVRALRDGKWQEIEK